MTRCSIVPYRQAVHRCAACVLVPAVFTALAGCRPPATTTPTASATIPPTATAPATRTPRPTRTATSTATSTPVPTATIDWSAPVPVAMTLEDGKAAVMRWIASADAPRIEWAGYVRGDKVAAAAWARTNRDGVFLRDQFSGVYEMEGSPIPTGPLVAVIATAGRLEAPLFRLAPADLDKMFIGSGPARQTILGLFDAQSGARAAAVPDPSSDARALIRSSRIDSIQMGATPVPLTPTATYRDETPVSAATPTIALPRLTVETVPDALQPVLAAYPLLPGSRWTWITRSAKGGVTWDEVRMTETVRAAWLLDARHAVVLSVRERTLVSGDPDLEIPAHDTDEVWRTVTADGGVYQYPADKDGCGNDPFAASEAVAADIGLPMETLTDPQNQLTWTCVFGGSAKRVSISVPAGTFDDCRIVSTVGGNSGASTRAVCRGVGYVESDSWHLGNWHSGYAVMRLESYDVVRPR